MLLQAGIDQIAISLDYPDARHDSFRGVPGLFNRIETLITGLGHKTDKSITLSCVVQSDNFRNLIRMVELANDWNVNINFSTYTWLRTDDKHFIPTRQQLREFRPIVTQLVALRDKYNNIFTSPYVFSNMIRFFENQSVPNCQTGVKFLNINPDGTMSPCGLIIRDYRSQKELRKNFSCHNSCTSCYTSLRANSEKPLSHLIRDNLRVLSTY
jgi:MoaA/NifB/PqqE/SkfB family radical SAM enzyme